MAKFKKEKISVNDAVDAYYNKHSSQLKKIFKSEKAAKDYMTWADPESPRSGVFKSKGAATQHYNDLIEAKVNPLAAELKRAKKLAENVPDEFQDKRRLNKRIRPDGFIQDRHDLGEEGGKKTTVIGYYEISGSDYVLAQVETKFGSSSPITGWQYVDKSKLGV